MDEKGEKSSNPQYQTWMTKDGLLTSWFTGTVEKDVLKYGF